MTLTMTLQADWGDMGTLDRVPVDRWRLNLYCDLPC